MTRLDSANVQGRKKSSSFKCLPSPSAPRSGIPTEIAFDIRNFRDRGSLASLGGLYVVIKAFD
jgi:hypothetical protein